MNRHTHIGVYGIIEQADKLLLIKKARGPYIGLLDLPGGGIEFGETPDEALKREIIEETGLTVAAIRLVRGTSFCFQHNCTQDKQAEELHHIAFFYSVTCNNSKNIKTDADGLDSLGALWLSKNDCDLTELSPLSKFALTLL